MTCKSDTLSRLITGSWKIHGWNDVSASKVTPSHHISSVENVEPCSSRICIMARINPGSKDSTWRKMRKRCCVWNAVFILGNKLWIHTLKSFRSIKDATWLYSCTRKTYQPLSRTLWRIRVNVSWHTFSWYFVYWIKIRLSDNENKMMRSWEKKYLIGETGTFCSIPANYRRGRDKHDTVFYRFHRVIVQ